MSYTWMSHAVRVTHVIRMNESRCLSTGWRVPLDTLREDPQKWPLQVIFRIRATYYRTLLRKTTYKDNASYGSSPPCNMWLYDIGWLWLVCSIKTQVSFAEYSLFYRAFLQKRPAFLGSLLILATSYYTTHSAGMRWQISPPKCIVENKDPCIQNAI